MTTDQRITRGLPFEEAETVTGIQVTELCNENGCPQHGEDNCPGCPGLGEVMYLIDCLVKDIRELEAAVVWTRYELSSYLPDYEQMLIRTDIVSGLAGRYQDDPVYQIYMKYAGEDPLESEEQVRRILGLAHIPFHIFDDNSEEDYDPDDDYSVFNDQFADS